jgi:hypothetical protein
MWRLHPQGRKNQQGRNNVSSNVGSNKIHAAPHPRRKRSLKSARELCRLRGRRCFANLVSTFADKGVSRGQRNGS